MADLALLARPPENLADQAHRQLTGMILERELPSGTFVVEERLAELLDISRTPVREAILRLAAEGLLVKNGSRSYAVRTVTAVEFFQSHMARELLEPEAVELAVGNLQISELEEMRKRVEVLSAAEHQARAHWEVDDLMHLMFADNCGNAVIAGMIRQARVSTRLFEVSNPLRRVRKDGSEHLAILDAAIAGDAKVARRAMQKHIRNLASDTMTILSGL